MKIHIMGASCAGSTTLGKTLSERLGFPYFDTDTYFWEISDPLFTIRCNPDERNQTIKRDLARQDSWILGGSVINWGQEWKDMFDLVVFLYIPREIRMQRLREREIVRYGDSIFTDHEQASKYQAFTEWAYGYDDNTTSGRNLKAHESWLEQLICPVIRINGDTTIQERTDIIINHLNTL